MMPEERVQNLILDQLKTLREEQQAGFTSVRSEFNQRLERLVSHEAFQAEQRRVDDKFLSLTAAVLDERTSRIADVQEEVTSRSGAINEISLRVNRISNNLKWAVAAVILPTVMFIATLIMQYSIARGDL